MEAEDEVDAEILEPFQLHFSDLQLLSSSRVFSSSSPEEIERLESISRAVMETLGPSGPGLLVITGVPKASELRQSLLPLARKLALLNKEDRLRILKEHNLGSDVPLKNPDRSVSSFAMQLKYGHDTSLDPFSGEPVMNCETRSLEAERFHKVNDHGFNNLGNIFKELGVCMMELGLQLARVCDRVIGGHELEESILDSCTAKGRLIHYHSSLDNLILKEAGRVKGSIKKPANYRFISHCRTSQSELGRRGDQVPEDDSKLETCRNEDRYCRTSLSNLWQQWHYDYGIFTLLTGPMFTSLCDQFITKGEFGLCGSCEQEHSSPEGHTYLQIFDPNKNGILLVRTPADSFVVQVGESADILSKGNLRSTLHSVSRPLRLENMSRETFVVFLQPSWNKIFSLSEFHNGNPISSGQLFRLNCKDVHSSSDSVNFQREEQEAIISQKIHTVIPPLSSRLKDGMTFAEFSRETTKQYYGSHGMQSKR